MTRPTLNIALQNKTTSNVVYAYISGLALNRNNAVFLLRSDGKTGYYPASPSSTITPLSKDCAIPLGNPGATTTVTIPQIAGGRIWFSIDRKLTFFLNPGPALVEPSVTNPTDPNIDITWGFCEFTFNSAQLFANISYVDFVCLPISLTLTTDSGEIKHVAGMPDSGLATVCSALRAQSSSDGLGWDSLIVNSHGKDLRVLSPNNAIVMNPTLFADYFKPYVDQVWSKYSSTPLQVDTQASFGTLSGKVVGNQGLTFKDTGHKFTPPSAADIFSCSTGPFADCAEARGPLTARLAAAFNRSTLLVGSEEPTVEGPAEYYKHPITNHYSRVVHDANLDGRGYAFPYDDVAPSDGADQSGAVFDGAPQLLTVAVGGVDAHS